MEGSFWSFTISDVINTVILAATIAAIVYGPIKAVEISRSNDQHIERDRRRSNVLAALMKTRKAYMLPDHVWALNLVQLEFDEPEVDKTFRAYIGHLGEPVPGQPNDFENFAKRRDSLFFDLLHSVCVATGRNIDKADLERLAYVPFGWQTEQEEAQQFRRLIIELLNGRRALPVIAGQAAPYNPFPPAP